MVRNRERERERESKEVRERKREDLRFLASFPEIYAPR